MNNARRDRWINRTRDKHTTNDRRGAARHDGAFGIHEFVNESIQLFFKRALIAGAGKLKNRSGPRARGNFSSVYRRHCHRRRYWPRCRTALSHNVPSRGQSREPGINQAQVYFPPLSPSRGVRYHDNPGFDEYEYVYVPGRNVSTRQLPWTIAGEPRAT